VKETGAGDPNAHAPRSRAFGRSLKKAKLVAATGDYADTDELIRQLSPAYQAILKNSLSAADRLALKALCEAARVRRRRLRSSKVP
jgi:hypothetical protein